MDLRPAARADRDGRDDGAGADRDAEDRQRRAQRVARESPAGDAERDSCVQNPGF
jgi:hypothetical protein